METFSAASAEQIILAAYAKAAVSANTLSKGL